MSKQAEDQKIMIIAIVAIVAIFAVFASHQNSMQQYEVQSIGAAHWLSFLYSQTVEPRDCHQEAAAAQRQCANNGNDYLSDQCRAVYDRIYDGCDDANNYDPRDHRPLPGSR